jgi:hypothetical protein
MDCSSSVRVTSVEYERLEGGRRGERERGERRKRRKMLW